VSTLIALTGRMGSGKSTVCQIINKAYRTELVKFAQPLYDMQEYIYDRVTSVYTRPKDFVKDRKLLQWLGTEWGRETISQSVWVDIFSARVREIRDEEAALGNEVFPGTPDFILNDDTRFDNEAEAVRALGGKIIRIVADQQVRAGRMELKETGHASENGIADKYVDYVITNNGSRAELEAQVREVLGRVQAGDHQVSQAV
jgi:dephospho-CoA kinase